MPRNLNNPRGQTDPPIDPLAPVPPTAAPLPVPDMGQAPPEAQPPMPVMPPGMTGGTAPNEFGTPFGGERTGAGDAYAYGDFARNGAPTDLNTFDPADMSTLAPYSDAAYSEATRRLDPAYAQREREFRNRMLSRGMAEGSAGWDSAYDDFTRERNDAYGSARNQALMQGLAAQQQGFGQRLGEAGLNEQVMGRMQSGHQFGQQLGEGRRQFDEGTRRFDLGRLDQLDDTDFGRMMTLLGFDMGGQQFDANAFQSEYGNLLPLMGMIPNQGPTGIDVLGPYGLQMQGEAARMNAAGQAQNGFWGSLGTLGAGLASAGSTMPWFLSDRTCKDSLGPVDPKACLKALLSIPMDKWAYKHDGTAHIGPYAQDFHTALGLEPNNVIWIADFLGALMGAVQALAAEHNDLRARLDALEGRKTKKAA